MPKKLWSRRGRGEAGTGSSSKKGGPERKSQDNEPHGDNDGMGGYRQKIRGKKLTEANKKSGCFPKLFVLLLPFLAVGTFLFLN